MKKIRNILIFIILVLPDSSRGQPFIIDNSFSSAFDFNYSLSSEHLISSIYEYSNGSLLLSGYFYSSGQGCGIVRLMPNGSQDVSLNFVTCSGSDDYFIDTIYDGNFIYFTNSWWGKLNNMGTVVDPAWSNKVNLFDPCTKMEPFIFQDGRILAGRYPCPHDTTPEMVRYFVRLLQDGSIDTSFHHNTDAFVVRLFRYDTSRLLVHSYSMTMYDSVPVYKLCRIDTSGNLDTTFHSIFTGWGGIRDCYVQPDGKIVAGGFFFIQGYPDTLNLIRLNVDGSLDSTFNNFNNMNYGVYPYKQIITICPTSDGGYLVGGQFIGYQGYNLSCIAKTDSNGYLDTTDFAGQGITGTVDGSQPMVNKIKKSLLADKYYVAGRFTTFNGQG
ncbi:MAG: delta-60 repeat domain-containing protein, partial [Bacteroidia bacterium]|nr:delta-60 repeat domain-containing protein [Bacteroidia bacterium]